MYSTFDDVKGFLAGYNPGEEYTAEINAKISISDSHINAKLASRYVVPFSTAVLDANPIIKSISAMYTAGLWLKARVQIDAVNASGVDYCSQADGLLQDYVNGTISVSGATLVASTTSGNAVSMNYPDTRSPFEYYHGFGTFGGNADGD